MTTAGLASAVGVYGLLQWRERAIGATAIERRHEFPGDDLITEADGVKTHALDIDADVRSVWVSLEHVLRGRPWCVGRATSQTASERPRCCTVEQSVPNRNLVLSSSRRLPTRWARRGALIDWTQSVVLDDLGQHRTRLAVRSRFRLAPSRARAFHLGVVVRAEFAVSRKLLRDVKRGAERSAIEPPDEQRIPAIDMRPRSKASAGFGSPASQRFLSVDLAGDTVYVMGELDSSSVRAFVESMRRFSNGLPHLQLDLAEVTFINSDALHALLEVCASMSVQVTAISPEVDRVLGLTGAREFVVGGVH